MRLALLAGLAGAVMGLTYVPAQAFPELTHAPRAQIALEAPQYWGSDPSLEEKPQTLPTLPDRPEDHDWNDTADTVENLDALDTGRPEVHLETDLNNDPSDPLLEDHDVEPVDNLPAEDMPDLFPAGQRDPLKEPLP